VLIPGDGAAHVGAATAPNEIALAVDLCQNWEPKAEASYDCDNYRQILSQSLQTTITLASYEILDNETTNAQYQLCVTEGGCTPVGWRYPGKANYPAVGLNWLQADEYCSWLGGRLPSEAEWEKAARGPNGWSFPWGNDWQDGQRANLRASGASGSQLVTTFADRDHSGYGINNLAGNVREWTASAYAPYPATLENGWVVSPTVIQNPDLSVVVRGGGWKSSAVFALSAMRWPVALISPQDSVPWDEIGFRCVCSIPGTCREPWNNGGWQWFGEY
jgi:formylglycine-generating enzyme required for sulfatase activity